MVNIAIEGHLTRGKEVIQILESLGGKNINKLSGNGKDCEHYYHPMTQTTGKKVSLYMLNNYLN